MNRAGRIGEFRPDGDIFHEEEAPVWKKSTSRCKPRWKLTLLYATPSRHKSSSRKMCGLLRSLARRLPLPVSDEDHNSQRWALSKEFDEF